MLPEHFGIFKRLINSDLEYNRIIGYKKRKDQYSTLIGRMLILYYLRNSGYCNIKEVPPILYNSFGKPFLPDCPSLNFNISHSKNIVIIGFSLDTPIGVDIEFVENKVNIQDYIDIFNEIEMKNISNTLNTFNQFYISWTRKEAILKALGYGFSLNPHLLNTLENNIRFNGINIFTETFTVKCDYIISISSLNRKNTIEFSQIHLNSLLSMAWLL